MATTIALLVSLVVAASLLATPASVFFGSVYTVGGRSPFRPLGGQTEGELEQEAAGRLLDYRAQLAAAICAILGAGAAFASVATNTHTLSERLYWTAVGLGIAAISLIPWSNIRSSEQDFGVLLEIERLALTKQHGSFGSASNHLAFQRSDLAKTIRKLRKLRGFSDDRERKTIETLRSVVKVAPEDKQGHDAA